MFALNAAGLLFLSDLNQPKTLEGSSKDYQDLLYITASDMLQFVEKTTIHYDRLIRAKSKLSRPARRQVVRAVAVDLWYFWMLDLHQTSFVSRVKH
jgi:hypothetical protein